MAREFSKEGVLKNAGVQGDYELLLLPEQQGPRAAVAGTRGLSLTTRLLGVCPRGPEGLGRALATETRRRVRPWEPGPMPRRSVPVRTSHPSPPLSSALPAPTVRPHGDRGFFMSGLCAPAMAPEPFSRCQLVRTFHSQGEFHSLLIRTSAIRFGAHPDLE